MSDTDTIWRDNAISAAASDNAATGHAAIVYALLHVADTIAAKRCTPVIIQNLNADMTAEDVQRMAEMINKAMAGYEQAGKVPADARYELAEQIEPILALLHHRGLLDTAQNRADVEEALNTVRRALAEDA